MDTKTLRWLLVPSLHGFDTFRTTAATKDEVSDFWTAHPNLIDFASSPIGSAAFFNEVDTGWV